MIFVVEDDHGVRELELYALRQSGYEAEGYETPTAFRQALEKTVPDCVLLEMVRKSYELAEAKLTKRQRSALAERIEP